jgi:hypothetical protein
MNTPHAADAPVDPDTFANPGPQPVASRRHVLRLLAAFDAVTPSAAPLAAIEAGLADAQAEAAPGVPVPRLSLYTQNWPDMIELWRQLSWDWAQLGIELDVQQGTLDTFVSQIVAEQKVPHLGSMSWGARRMGSIRITSSPRCFTPGASSRVGSSSASTKNTTADAQCQA